MVMRGKYKCKANFDKKQKISIHLKWNYFKYHICCSMRDYVKQALEKLKHMFVAKHHYRSSKIKQSDYEAQM